MSSEELLPEDIDLDFSRESSAKIYRTGAFRGINPLRWDRIHNEIEFEDVVSELTGLTAGASGKISCPFHGRDSTPSFTIYQRGNDATCFGCPAGQNYYNSDRFVATYLGISRVKALIWLERKWNLPPIDDVQLEVEEDEELNAIQLEFQDIVPSYLLIAERDVQEHQDLDLWAEYRDIYFDALHTIKQAEELRKNPDDDPEEALSEAKRLEDKAALLLAQVVGKKVLQRLLERKG